MFIVINRLRIKPAAGEKLIERFTQSHGLEDSPGFIRFRLLEPAWSPGDLDEGEYLSMTEWASREAFQRWLDSDAFKRAHTGGDNSIFAGPPRVAGYQTCVDRASRADDASPARPPESSDV